MPTTYDWENQYVLTPFMFVVLRKRQRKRRESCSTYLQLVRATFDLSGLGERSTTEEAWPRSYSEKTAD
jgi:hypothetical protein